MILFLAGRLTAPVAVGVTVTVATLLRLAAERYAKSKERQEEP